MSLNNQADPRLKQALENWRAMSLTEKPTLIRTFSAGLNHHTYLISSANQQVIMKLFSKPSANAIEVHDLAASRHCAPDVLYVNPDFDIALFAYINTDSVCQPINQSDLIAFGNTLKQLHSLTDKPVRDQIGDFNLPGFYATYLSKIDPRNSQIRSIHDQLQPIIRLFLEDTTPWCICHNDLVKENCFIISDKALFIDWEYAQVNNPWFDLATLIYSLNLNQQQAASMIEQYRPDWRDKVGSPIYFAAQCAVLWCDILWNLARGQHTQTPNLQKKLADLQALAKQK